MTEKPVLSIAEQRETFVRPDGSTYTRGDIFVKLFVTFRDVMLAELKGPQLSVYLCISLHCGEEMTAWPSLATISQETGYSRPAVSKAIQSLIDRGLIEKQSRETDAGDRDSNLYTVAGYISMGKPSGRGGKLGLLPGKPGLPRVVNQVNPKKNHKKNDDDGDGGLQAAQRLALHALVYLGVHVDVARRIAAERDPDTIIAWCAALQHAEIQGRATNLPGLLVSKLNSGATPAVYQESTDAFLAELQKATPELERLLARNGKK